MHSAQGWEPDPTAEASRMFRRVLQGWIIDCARLRRRGMDRPSFRAGGPASSDRRITAPDLPTGRTAAAGASVPRTGG